MRAILFLSALLCACDGGATTAPAPKPEVTKETPKPEVKADPATDAVAKVMFIAPTDGAKVTSPFMLEMGVEGMEVKPAGEVVEGTGHHHLIVNGKAIDKGTIVPMDDTHIHYGDGRTETEVELPPGEHTLTLQFADGIHTSFGPEMSATIKVEVVEGEADGDEAAEGDAKTKSKGGKAKGGKATE